MSEPTPPPPPFALVVDDDPIQRHLIAAVLKKFGIANEVVSGSKDFLLKIKTSEPDFCLIDLNIENLGVGFTIIEAIRKVRGPKLVLIVISGNSDKNAIAHALEVGANDYITKPIDRQVLISKISYYVQTPQLLDATSPLLPVPDGGVPATFQLDLDIQSVDEFGLKIISKHLLSKGLALRLEGSFISTLTGSDAVRLNVTSTWAEQNGYFGASAEFDSTNERLMATVRKWLSTQTKTSI